MTQSPILDRRFVAAMLTGTAACFWTGWMLMPGVGITDAGTILTLVAMHPDRVLVSALLQLASAALLALAIPGLATRFVGRDRRWGALATGLLSVGACGDAADAIYHQLAYEMVRPGVDANAMLPVMQRMQSFDLLFLLPMITAFLFGCVALSVSAARLKIVSRWNPFLYVTIVTLTVAGSRLAADAHLERMLALLCLGLLAASLAWIAIGLMRTASSSDAHD
jgi:hypothetical protein